MLKNSIVFSCVLGFVYITLCSDIDGAAHHGHGNITGSTTGTVGKCQTSSCHGGNNAATLVSLQVLDTSTMAVVDTYNAQQTYLVTMSGNDTAVATNLPGFGFMASAVLANHTQAGTFSIPTTLASQIHTFNCGTTTVVEHTATLAQTVTGINKYNIQFYWTAPAVRSDSVSFYYLLNAVNGNGGSSGDYPNAGPKVTIYESATSGVVHLSHENLEIHVFPNPSLGEFNIAYPVYSENYVSIEIMDMSGKVIKKILDHQYQQIGMHSISALMELSGVYIVRVIEGTQMSYSRIIKL